jgi:hypothetical protein
LTSKTGGPELTKLLDPEVFKQWLWSNEELKDFCAAEKLESHGPKEFLSARIERYLKTGKKWKKSSVKLSK